MPPAPDAPPTLRFGVAVSINHDHAQLTLAGEIDMANADDVRRSAQYYLDEPSIIQVSADLDALTFIDSVGLRALILCRRYADAMGKSFLIEHSRGHVAEIVETSGLTRYLTDPSYRPAN